MSVVPRDEMTVDQFLDWAKRQHDERYELIDGVVIRSQSERLVHSEQKFDAGFAMRTAVRATRRPCFVLVDGPHVRITKKTTFRPDGLIYCGPRHPRDVMEVPNPMVVYEVVSPDSGARDHGDKLRGYFSVGSIQHYLVIDPDQRMVIVHSRPRPGTTDPTSGPDVLLTRIVTAGDITLEPPGITIAIADLFERDPEPGTPED